MKPTLFLKQRNLEAVCCTLNQQPWIEVLGSRKVWMEILLTHFYLLSFHHSISAPYLMYHQQYAMLLIVSVIT